MSRIIHFELRAEDVERTRQFYESVFDWEFKKHPGFAYYSVKTGDESKSGINGGLGEKSGEFQSLTNTIETTSLDQTITKIEGAGGRMISPRTTIPGLGHIIYFEDPEGNQFAILERDRDAKIEN